MDTKRLFGKISSKYIIEEILSYIKDKNLKYNLFKYSKKFQRKLDLSLVDYQELYLNNLGMKLNNYLYSEKNEDPKTFSKYILTKNLQHDIIKYKINKNIFEKVILHYFNKKAKTIKNNFKDFESEQKIEIYSPFFDLLSKTDIFSKCFVVTISINVIKKHNLKNDYISVFEKLNKSEINYSSIILNFNEYSDIYYLNEFKINLNNLKRIDLNQAKGKYNWNHITANNNNILLKNLFSFNNIANNLVHLNINLYTLKTVKIKQNLIEQLNNFKSLVILNLSGLKFENDFMLKLTNLKKLYLEDCHNITFSDDSTLGVKNLCLEECSITKKKSDYLFEFPNLESCDFFNLDEQEFFLIINFDNLQKLKHFSGEICDFIKLESELLESITLYSIVEDSYGIEKQMFEKIFSLNYIKEIEIDISILNEYEIDRIKGDNTSAQHLKINWNNRDYDCIINNILNKFKNLTSIEINYPIIEEFIIDNEDDENELILDIIEKSNCKIKKLSLHIENINKEIQFYCGLFENLEEINIKMKFN